MNKILLIIIFAYIGNVFSNPLPLSEVRGMFQQGEAQNSVQDINDIVQAVLDEAGCSHPFDIWELTHYVAQRIYGEDLVDIRFFHHPLRRSSFVREERRIAAMGIMEIIERSIAIAKRPENNGDMSIAVDLIKDRENLPERVIESSGDRFNHGSIEEITIGNNALDIICD